MSCMYQTSTNEESAFESFVYAVNLLSLQRERIEVRVPLIDPYPITPCTKNLNALTLLESDILLLALT